MKKILLSLACLLFTCFSYAQQNQIPDGSFENKWVTVNSFRGPYLDYGTGVSDILRTLNSLYGFEGQEFQTELTAFRETNAQNGQYAIKLVSTSFAGQLFVPGAFGTITDDFIASYIEYGGINVIVPFVGKPLFLTGYYKYAPVLNDSAIIELGFYEYGTPLGAAKLTIRNAVSEWTYFRIPITYNFEYADPNELKLLFVSSGGYDFNSLENCRGQLNSTFYIDNIAFDYTNGITQPLVSQVNSKAYPNPAKDNITIKLLAQIKGKILIYNSKGALVAEQKIESESTCINTSNYNSGAYYYQILDNKTIISTGRFVIE